ncbi:MAG: hypothetical protein JNJ40_00035 [Bacteroidia bacterium]|nr:hypothetical protein [Bacteroidia bacterium]
MMRFKRRYIALTALIISILILVSYYFSQSDIYVRGSSVNRYFDYFIISFQLILMVVVFKSKNNETKNMLTTLTVIITILYLLSFFYNLIVN